MNPNYQGAILAAALTFMTISGIVATIEHARNKRRPRRRRIGWICLECGHNETTRARTTREAWSWIGAHTRVHASTVHDGAEHVQFTAKIPDTFQRE